MALPMEANRKSVFTQSVEVIKEGYLLVKSRSRLRSTWRKTWCQVRRNGSSGRGPAVQLSQYKSQVDAAQDLGCFARIDLGSATCIRPTPEEKKKHSFLVECTSAARIGDRHMALQSTTFYFGASCEDAAEEWVQVLRQSAPSSHLSGSTSLRKNLTGSLPDLSKQGDPKQRDSLHSLDFNKMYQPSASTYSVHLEPSPLVPFSGESTLTITASSLTLSDPKSSQQVEWPVNSIRKFGLRDHFFYFESGRSCSTGPATFSFNTDTNVAEEIAKKLRFVSKKLADGKYTDTEVRPSIPSVNTRPQCFAGNTEAVQIRSSCIRSEPSVKPLLVRSTSDNVLLSENVLLQKFNIDEDNAGPYSITRIRDSWIALSKALNKSNDEETNMSEEEDDVGELSSFPNGHMSPATTVKIRSHSAPVQPIVPPLKTKALPSTDCHKYETMRPGAAGRQVEKDPCSKDQVETRDIRYSEVKPKCRPLHGSSPPTPPKPARVKDFSPLQLESDANTLNLEASAQAALKRRYSPIFVASRDPSSRLRMSPSPRGSPSFPGTPYASSPLLSPAQLSSPPRSPPQTQSPSPLRSPMHSLSSTSPDSAGYSPLNESPLASSVSSHPSAACSIDSRPPLDLPTNSSQLGIYSRANIQDEIRVRSASEPAMHHGYDRLDHDSKRVIDGYARLAHPPPDLPPKPFTNDRIEQYNKLNDPIITAAAAASKPGLPRRKVAKRAVETGYHRTRTQSDSLRHTGSRPMAVKPPTPIHKAQVAS
ncbi:uncharacterized protein LOC135821589 [Sycon ciliatum]|uniref:uncharacterized protein LOC135821589 n=1 Tax=Sycon ciliatum TaxID=27933 RepID=UPI0031F6B4D3